MNKQLLCVIVGILVLALAAVPLSQWYTRYRLPEEEVFVDTGETEIYAAVDAVPTAAASATISLPDEPLPEGVEAELENGFILKEYEGEIAVFFPGDSEPGLLTGIPVSVLRSTDRAALSQGIYVESVDEVAALVEDLGS